MPTPTEDLPHSNLCLNCSVGGAPGPGGEWLTDDDGHAVFTGENCACLSAGNVPCCNCAPMRAGQKFAAIDPAGEVEGSVPDEDDGDEGGWAPPASEPRDWGF